MTDPTNANGSDGGQQLTIIFPAFNEATRIERCLTETLAWLDAEQINAEIIVVDDGSTDETTTRTMACAQGDHRIRLLTSEKNYGKGHAVRQGMLAARGRELLFSDVDLSTPLAEYHKLTKFLSQADIVIGSRAMRQSEIHRHQPWYREVMGKIFNGIVRLFVVTGMRDTQCGFKLFRASAAHRIFPQCHIDGFAFDVEVLYIAHRLGLQIAQVPIRWINDPLSRVHPVRDACKMFRELLRIRAIHREQRIP